MQAQIEEEQKALGRQSWGMRTRRTNKEENIKTKKMCQALEYAERKGNPAEIEGELKDMPVTEEDHDWNLKDKGAARKSGKGKKNQ